jgi:hypothetical protein
MGYGCLAVYKTEQTTTHSVESWGRTHVMFQTFRKINSTASDVGVGFWPNAAGLAIIESCNGENPAADAKGLKRPEADIQQVR